MTFAKIIKRIPEYYALDIKNTMMAIFSKPGIPLGEFTVEQFYGIALTVGYALKNEYILNNIRAEAKMYLEEKHADACKMAVTMMSMNNCYYSYVYDSLQDQEILNIGSELEMQSLKNPEIPLMDFEIFCLTASILNKCKMCIEVHSKKLLERGLSKKGLRDIGRIVAVIKAAADAIDIESLRSYDFVVRVPSI